MGTIGENDPVTSRRPQVPALAAPSEPSVRSATASDAPGAGRLHTELITEGFLPVLGPRFLRLLYRRIVLDPGSFLLVAGDGPALDGFVAGTSDVSALYRAFILRDGLAAAGAAAVPLLTHWRRVVETMRHGAPGGGVGTGRGVELLSIAVAKEAQGRGVGRALVAAFLREVVDRAASAAYVVVGADNDAAISLYRSAGFADAQELELHAGTPSKVLQWEPRGGPTAAPGAGAGAG